MQPLHAKEARWFLEPRFGAAAGKVLRYFAIPMGQE